ncbi:hypothetical protein BHM03_00058803 [Ensete ventricosum]|nr:hypothetical protein BHM03_00058803 [Ensete ventricosum]
MGGSIANTGTEPRILGTGEYWSGQDDDKLRQDHLRFCRGGLSRSCEPRGLFDSANLRMSSLLQLWITSQLIIFMIWKSSDTESNSSNQPRCLELSLHLDPESLDNWYRAPSSSHDPPEPESTPPSEVKKEVVDAHHSMDDRWKAILERSSVTVKRTLSKSETWQGRGTAAERAVARRADTAKKRPEVGWRGREVLVVGQDELFQRVETFIKQHYDHLRRQRQESKKRRFLEGLQCSS